MPQTLMLTGDVNLMNVTDPTVPFKIVAPIFAKSDFVFSNLECCFYIPPGGHCRTPALVRIAKRRAPR